MTLHGADLVKLFKQQTGGRGVGTDLGNNEIELFMVRYRLITTREPLLAEVSRMPTDENTR